MAELVKLVFRLFISFMIIYHAFSSETVDSDTNEVSVNKTEDYISRVLEKIIAKKPSLFFCLGKLIKANPAIISPDPVRRLVFIPNSFHIQTFKKFYRE